MPSEYLLHNNFFSTKSSNLVIYITERDIQKSNIIFKTLKNNLLLDLNSRQAEGIPKYASKLNIVQITHLGL